VDSNTYLPSIIGLVQGEIETLTVQDRNGHLTPEEEYFVCP